MCPENESREDGFAAKRRKRRKRVEGKVRKRFAAFVFFAAKSLFAVKKILC
jgi:hypothetical protein